MTQEEAFKEAQRRWGPNGFAEEFANGWREVGRAVTLLGKGWSWEEAFSYADRSENAQW